MKRAHEHPALASLGSVKYWPAFNLFRRKLKPDLICAVPEDYPVPGFIEGSTWAFAGKVSEPITIPLGFKSKAAEAGVRFNGFYLFQASPIERGRVEDGRGSLGHAATPRFPSPLVKPDVRIGRVAQPLLAFAPTDPIVRRYRNGLFKTDLRRMNHPCHA